MSVMTLNTPPIHEKFMKCSQNTYTVPIEISDPIYLGTLSPREKEEKSKGKKEIEE